MLGIGIIGMGGVSRFYVDALAAVDGAELVAVCDVNPARLEPFAGRPGIAAHASADALLDDPRVQAVVLDTPVPTHVPLSSAALAAGRHVCCEKPLALTRADAAALGDLARARSVTLFTAFHRRYNRNLPAPETLDRDGIASVEVRYHERIEEHTDDMAWYGTPASAGGGCIVDNGPNAVDVVRHLFGDMTVRDVQVGRSPQGVDLNAVIRGGVAGGVQATVRLDWAYPHGECKDLRIAWEDGRELHADMLGGFEAFKSSLEHEYVGVLEAFVALVAAGEQDTGGAAATAWLEDVLKLAPPEPPSGTTDRANGPGNHHR